MKQGNHSRQALSFGILAAVFLLLSVACNNNSSRNDAQIIGEVSTRIQSDAHVPNKNIAIMSNKGVVTLNGTANNDAERLAASNDASQVEGVKTVINNLAVVPPAPQATLIPTPNPIEAPVVAKPSVSSHERSKPSPYHQKNSEPAKSADNTSTVASANTGGPISNAGIAMPPASSDTSTATPAKSDRILIPPPPLPVKMITIDSGTAISVRLTEPIDSSRNHVGDTFRATLDSPVYAGDEVAIPSGANVFGKITEVQDSGHFTGRAQLALELTSLSINGRRYQVRTNQFTQQGNSQGTRTAKTVGTGAAVGALIGAIAGGGKGAAIGAGVGAAGGGGVQAARGTQPVHLGSEARLRFQLEDPLSVAPVSSTDRNKSNSDYNDSAMNQPNSYGGYRDNYPSRSSSNTNSDNSDRPVLKRRPSTDNNSNENNGPN
jgi:hypothetical protein